MTLYILYGYNNYYNRILKRENTINDYIESEDIFSYYVAKDVNFVPNDGINATQILGTNTNNFDGGGDYLVVTDSQTNEIVSRWFIIESTRDRAGQYHLTLHRDLLADYYDDVIDAPMFIEKATLNPDDPLIFNSEQMTVNQIKVKEKQLYDETGCAWIVGYYDKSLPQENASGSININNDLNAMQYIYINKPFSDWEYNTTSSGRAIYSPPQNLKYKIYGENTTTSVGFQQQQGPIILNAYTADYESVGYSTENTPYALNFNYNAKSVGEQISRNIKDSSLISTMLSQALDYVSNGSDYNILKTQSEFENFMKYNGATIKDSLGDYYSIQIKSQGDQVNLTSAIPAGSLFQSLSSVLPTNVGTPDAHSFSIEYTSVSYKVYAQKLDVLSTTWEISSDRVSTQNAPYDIFAIPYGELAVSFTDDNTSIVTSKEIAIATANSIINKMQPSSSGGFLYDIQLLPYAPFTTATPGAYTASDSRSYSKIIDHSNEDAVVGIIINVSSSQFTKNIYMNESIQVKNPKIESECDIYKLCSPNWASEFQFNAAKNNGVQYFNIDCDYKPFSPYIHVNPNFSGLYGRDFNDARGLILSGDFSLSQLSDAWESYQIQNKNFQAIFDRQIQNMDVKNDISRIQDVVGAVAGTGTAGVAGGLALSSYAPGAGGLGMGIGTAAGAIGGIADIALNEKLRNEALDYTKDMFGYQLGNVQALPHTITKVSAFNNNNKIFPILEYYTCTDIEKRALANKIAYNGMSVGVIGKIKDYMLNEWSYEDIESKGYIKGKLIRLESPEFSSQYNVVNAISNELNKGIYIRS